MFAGTDRAVEIAADSTVGPGYHRGVNETKRSDPSDAPPVFRRVAVYCGSSGRVAPAYLEAARDFGAFLAGRGIGVVYGGGRVGLMGALANGALGAGGHVTGVIPEKLWSWEQGHEGLSELLVVDSMHARKMVMASLSDAFVALPGGWGTLEEIFEVTTWTQLHVHRKPVGLLDVGGFFQRLVAFLDHARDEGFIRDEHRDLLACDADPAALLDALDRADYPPLGPWITEP